MKYLFWNTHRNKGINDILREIIIENDISMVLLAEYEANPDELISMLAAHEVYMQRYSSCSEYIKMFGLEKNIKYRGPSDHYVICIINNEDILCCVHLNSKIYSGHEERRQIIISQIIRDIRNVEMELNSDNTIVTGDFNLNPYDASFVDARYFHGLPIYEDARKNSREILNEKYYMFYNPMWNLLGDFEQPYGTYYHSGNETVNTFWNIYDQVIIRPALRERFVKENLKIIKETKTKFLLNRNGHPDKKISDHLPIVFETREK